ncbi:MAG TPA: hypothetical protein VMT51_15210 [Dongiaceae bacterium]|nr:hypothetical protein [Dongiaceae bacterium]
MAESAILCDGCGQAAAPGHIARRLKRLEEMTQFRPIHVQALFLGAVSPAEDGAYLYSSDTQPRGQAAELLTSVGIDYAGREKAAVLAEFQRRGFLLTYVLDCPAAELDAARLHGALEKRLSATLTRVRRSFKPKRVIPLGREMAALLPQLSAASLEAKLVLSDGAPAAWSEAGKVLSA